MTKRTISTGGNMGPYSPAVIAGDFCYVSGQGPIDTATREVVLGDIDAETRRTLDNLRAVLAAAGYELDDVISTTCYLRSLDDWAAMNAAYAEYFPRDAPARATVGVADLPMGTSIQVSCVAWRAPK
jgi:2-iminobutanoate/2-iminopropanoate deaminase